MAKSILDIIINTIVKGADKPDAVAKSIINLKNGVGAAVGVFGAFAGATVVVDQALDATVGELVAYADQVRRVQGATGQSAEESSKLIQVLDDQKISYEQLEKAIAKSGAAYDFSIEGLANMSEEYLKLTDANEQASFMQERFGKQWISFVPIMQQGGQAIRDSADALDESLVLTQQGVDQAREYEIAMDNWGDAVLALKMDIATGLLPVLNDLITGESDGEKAFKAYAESIGMTGPQLDALGHGLRQFNAEAERGAAMTRFYTDELSEAGEVVETLAVNYDKLLGGIRDMQSETDRYTEAQDSANAAIAEADAEYAAGNLSAEEWSASLIDNQRKLDENAKAHKRWAAETVFAFAQAKAAADGNITQGEGEILIEMGVQLELFDEKTADVMENVNSAFDSVDTENAQSVIDALKAQLMQLTGEPWTITINTETNGSPTEPSHPGGGGFATGGAFDAGSPMLVHKDEIVVPDYGGVVLTRTDAMKLMQGNGGNGGGKTFINYGSMTFVVQGSVMDVLDELS